MIATTYILFAFGILVLLLPYLGRVFAGPTVFDRVIGLNGIGTKIPVLLIFIKLIYRQVDLVIDVVLALFLLNMVATLLLTKYVREKGGV